ncbi:alpha-amylase family glycosyl hydrolase [Kitasatospora xanthocidica]|uniref:alpha-amylase family glycosyl hydrolase n=1 Tax=Kitasatospora xanthocidica TaxID=83382 RepID=UPI0036E33C44
MVVLGSTLLTGTATGIAKAAAPPSPPWLSDAVLYTLYPQSFADSNGDGIGDIQGIIDHLDYLSWLGVNLIWIPPIYPSPFTDAGYDVTDYTGVAPRYGSKEDLVRLVDAAKRKGIRILLDLVAGHTSDQHPWFLASREDPNDGRYIWARPEEYPEGKVPGGFVPSTGARPGAFMQNYYDTQPALNYGYARMDSGEPWRQSVDAEGPRANRAALLDIMDHWLSLGVSGFRCDMAFSLVKDDGPRYPETTKLWQEIRRWLDRRYPQAMLISEWGAPSLSIPAGFHADFFLHDLEQGHGLPEVWNSLYNKDNKGRDPYFSNDGRGSAQTLVDTWRRLNDETGTRGYIALPAANFDDGNRLNDNVRDRRALKPGFVFQLTWPTVPTIFYGEEIGMRMIPGLAEKEGSDGRQRNRTPMQWDSTANAGFSTAPAEKLYLPIDDLPDRPTVEAQRNDPDSLLNLARRLIALRKENPAFGPGSGVRVFSTGYPFTYLRGDRYLVAVNPQRDAAEIVVDDIRLERARPVENLGTTISGTRLRIDGFGYGIFDLE